METWVAWPQECFDIIFNQGVASIQKNTCVPFKNRYTCKIPPHQWRPVVHICDIKSEFGKWQNSNQNTSNFFHYNAIGHVVRKISAVLFRPVFVNHSQFSMWSNISYSDGKRFHVMTSSYYVISNRRASTQETPTGHSWLNKWVDFLKSSRDLFYRRVRLVMAKENIIFPHRCQTWIGWHIVEVNKQLRCLVEYECTK